MAGDVQTGVDLMRMEARLDTGPIAMREVITIGPEDTTGDLTIRLAVVAAKLAASALRSMEAGLLEYRGQSSFGVCYAHKIEKSEAEIDWTRGAEVVRDQIHALSPAPGAHSGA
jgi:methionyl-tRNA formyltransferase